ncbi:MAG: GrpB family protein [Sphingobium sp.]
MNFEDSDPDEYPWIAGVPVPEEIEITAYSSEWPALFRINAALIATTLGSSALNIEHIGSTAVPTLAAKPIIDIDVIVRDPVQENDYIPRLAALGYQLTIRERSWYQHRMLRYDQPRINLHIFGPHCPEHVRHILFRDWLRGHPEDRARYAMAKNEARKGVTDIRDYNRNKQNEIRKIYRKIFQTLGWC